MAATLSDEQVKEIADLLKEHAQHEIDDKGNPEEIGASIHKGLCALGKKFSAMREGHEKLSAQHEKLAASRVEDKTIKIDPDVLDQLAETGEERLDNLVACSKLSQGVADKFKALLIGKAGARNAFALSRQVSKTDESLVKTVCTLLAENDVVKLGEATKSQQTVALSRQVPGKAVDEYDPKVTEAMLAGTGLTMAGN